MSITTLDSIATMQHDDPSNCLREMLAEWLRGGGDPPRTWSTIVAALKKVDGLGALGEDIEHRYSINEMRKNSGTNLKHGAFQYAPVED